MEPTEKLPIVISSFGVIFEENQFPLRVYLGHNYSDPHEPNDNEYQYKPEGYGLLGGGGKKGETPLQAAIREVADEGGLKTEIATVGENSRAGEILFESKPVIDTETEKPAINEVYIFHLKKIDGINGFSRIKETDETGRLMLATFGSILTMPLARKKIKNSDGSLTVIENSEGIYFSARERACGVAAHLGLDFYELIPNLEEVFHKIKKEEVGWYIYGLLSEAIENKKQERIREAQLAEEARLRRKKIAGSPDDEELLEKYANWATGTPCDLTIKR